MRISTVLLQRIASESILERQRGLEETRQRIASGRQLLAPSDDPIGAERLARLTRGLGDLRQFTANADRVSERLEVEDATLSNITNTLQRVRELAIAAGNPGLRDDDRASIVIELQGTLDTLVDLANTRDAGGEALFAGTRSDVLPWVRTVDGVVYDGDDQVRQVRIGTDARVADGHSGVEVFGSARSGNGTFATGIEAGNSGTATIDRGALTASFVPDDYRIEIVAGSPGPDYQVLDGGGGVVASGAYESGGTIEFAGVRVVVTGEPAVGDAFSVTPSEPITMFEAVRNLADAVALPDLGVASRTSRTGAQDAALADLDSVLNQIVDVRADIGTRLGFVATQKDLNESLELNAEEAASAIRDVDLVEAIVALESQATSLEAAQRAFARIQGLNLFRFLG